MSNGGRFYSPWDGRHKSVLGIEEAAVSFDRSESRRDQIDVAIGLVLEPDRTTQIRYAFGAIPIPEGWSLISDIVSSPNSLTLTDSSGRTHILPFDDTFFTVMNSS